MGQIAQTDSANCRHGNKLNTTGKSRASIDFRIIPISQYKDTDATSINMNMRFVIGEYFERLEE